MPGDDQPANEKAPTTGPLSLDDADRLSSHFTPMWEEPAAEEPFLKAESPPAPLVAPLQSSRESVPAAAASVPVAPVLAAQVPLPMVVAAVTAPLVEAVPVAAPSLQPAPPPPPAPAAPEARAVASLPDAKSEYAPPRPLLSPQRTMLGLAPPASVSVAPLPGNATTTPLGMSPPSSSRPALQVVTEASAPHFAIPEPELRSSPTRDTIPPLSRRGGRGRTGIVVGVLGVATALVAAVALTSMTGSSAESGTTTTRTEAVPAETPAKAAVPTAVTAARDEAPPPPPPEPEAPPATGTTPPAEPEAAEEPHTARAPLARSRRSRRSAVRAPGAPFRADPRSSGSAGGTTSSRTHPNLHPVRVRRSLPVRRRVEV